jgi:hypothetical protein
MPAFGITEIRPGNLRASHAMYGAMGSGPVAQFRPREKIGYGSKVAATAAMEVPSSIVPAGSMVTESRMGTSAPQRSRTRKADITAILACRRSWQVSMISASTPASTRASICSSYTAASSAGGIWPRDGGFVPGPTEPATYRPGTPAMAARAWATAARLISSTREPRPYSASTGREPPNVLVSSTRAPASRKPRCRAITASGAERFNCSLQPGMPPQASAGRPMASRLAPQEPSKIRSSSP